MTEYTPTTEDVREVILAASILIAQEAGVEPPDQGEVEAEFDRWLAEHDRQVAERAWDEAQQATYAKLRQIWPDYPEPAKNSRVSNPYRKEATGD